MDLRQIIIKEIQAANHHRIPFSHYMELALYHSTHGYYMRKQLKLGKFGDFFTNAHVGNVFGQVLGMYFLKLLPQDKSSWALIEMGAGDGRLAEQVCNTLLEAGVDASTVHLYLVEASPYHREVQKERLRESPFSIKWVSDVSDIPVHSFSIVYSNELVDAFPVHRVKRISENEIAEVYITWDSKKNCFLEEYGPCSNLGLEAFIQQFGYDLKINQSIEVNLNAKTWLECVASWMKNGYVLTIDYGATTRELLTRENGTLRCYHQHTMLENPFLHVGEVDITSHVNFDTLNMWGEAVGLELVSLSTQSQFLLQSGILDMLSNNDDYDPFSKEARKRRAIKQLVHPDTMGEIFKVLVQRKGWNH